MGAGKKQESRTESRTVNIVMIGPFAWHPKATVSARTFPIARALVRRGHKVTILLPPYDNVAASGREEVRDGVRIWNARITRDAAWARLSVPIRLTQRALVLRPDVIHVFKPVGYAGMCGLYLRLASRVPLVVDCDDWEGRGGWNEANPYSPLVKRVLDWQERWLPRHADAVTVASRVLETRAWGMGIRPARVACVPNCPGPLFAHPPPVDDAEKARVRHELGVGDAPLLMYVGYVPLGTDLDVLLEALPLVVRRVSQVRVAIVGDGPGTVGLRRQAKKQGLEDRLVFTGWVQHERVPAYLAAADVAVYPYRDNLINRAKCSVKIQEYMATGKAIVTTSVGQNLEYLVHGSSGLLTEPGNVEDFAQGLVTVLSDRKLAQEMGANARRRVQEKYRWDDWVQVVERTYESVMHH